MIERVQLQTLVERMREPRRFLQVLAGPRQVGKTTLVSQLVSRLDVPYTSVSADGVDASDVEWIARQWQIVRNSMLLLRQAEHVLIIDEIQLIDRWSEIVKREWDMDTHAGNNIKVILLGSSRLLIKDGLNESLAGRFELIHVPHWSFSEMREAFGFTLEQYIYYGAYPGSAALVGDEGRWRRYMLQSIIQPAIDRDVLMTKRILKPALLRQVFDMGASHSAELLALNKLVAQLQDAGNTSTVSNYIQVLGEAELLMGLQAYAPDVVRRYQSIPKMQVLNTALQTAYYVGSFADAYVDPARWGRWVESAVGAHLLNNASEGMYQVFYWRERNDEVDFVLVDGSHVLGIEVKSGHHGAGSGLRAFQRRFPQAKTLVVGTGGLPLDVFLSSSPAVLLRGI